MKNLFALLLLLVSSQFLGQNVGINTTSPQNSLHIATGSIGADPVRIEGVNMYSNERDFYVVDRNMGVVKYMPLDSLINHLPINNPINLDSIYTIFSDSLLSDSTWMDSLMIQIKNRIDEDTDVDSIYYMGDTLYVQENNKTFKTEILPSGGGSIGGYDTNEYLTGQVWIDGSPVYGRVIHDYTAGTPMLNLTSYFSPNYIQVMLDVRILADCSGTPNNSTHFSSYGNFSYNVGTNTLSSIGNSAFSNCGVGMPYILILEYTKQ